MTELHYLIDLDLALRRLQRPLAKDDPAAVVQREITDRLLERLDYMLIQPQAILEIVLHASHSSKKLRELYPQAKLASFSLTELINPYTHAIKLPCENASQNLVIVNSVLHWYVNPQAFLQEIRRVLRQDGVLLFCTMGPDTLHELRSACAQIDETPHVHDFLDMHDLGDLLQVLGFVDPVVDMHALQVKYADVMDLVNDLRYLAENNAHLDRQKGLMGKHKWQKIIENYRAQFPANGIIATYELIFGLAWGIRQVSHNGEISIPLTSIKR